VAAACGIWCFGFQVVGMVCPVCFPQGNDYLITNNAAQVSICTTREQSEWFACGLKAISNEEWEYGK
jgi:hypothetical protein